MGQLQGQPRRRGGLFLNAGRHRGQHHAGIVPGRVNFANGLARQLLELVDGERDARQRQPLAALGVGHGKQAVGIGHGHGHGE